jgi:serine/threonine protein kinase
MYNSYDSILNILKTTLQLGEGAFAVVKKATHKKTGGVYAVKIVNRKSLGSGLEQNLKAEIAILSDMNHDHIMCLHNVYVTINEYHLVTEFLEGGELFDRIVAKDSYTESEARDVCKVLFGALNYMAEKRVAHRDLKPENLLLQYKNSDSEIKVRQSCS